MSIGEGSWCELLLFDMLLVGCEKEKLYVFTNSLLGTTIWWYKRRKQWNIIVIRGKSSGLHMKKGVGTS